MSAWRCFSRFLSSIGEKRAGLIPSIELDKLLCRFFMEVVRGDGIPYQLVQQIALVELVQFVNSFNLFPNCTEAHLIFLYNYIGLLF